jgi:hypothetical protein
MKKSRFTSRQRERRVIIPPGCSWLIGGDRREDEQAEAGGHVPRCHEPRTRIEEGRHNEAMTTCHALS